MIPFFAFPPEVRRVIYTTNAIESLHMQLRKIIKTRGHFPSDEAAIKLHVARASQHPRRQGTIGEGVEGGHEPVRRHVRRPVHRCDCVNPASHTEFRTGPPSHAAEVKLLQAAQKSELPRALPLNRAVGTLPLPHPQGTQERIWRHSLPGQPVITDGPTVQEDVTPREPAEARQASLSTGRHGRLG